MDTSFRVLAWLYRRLGPAYPTLASACVHLGAFPVAVVSVLVLDVYLADKDMSRAEFALFMGIALAIAGLTLLVGTFRGHLLLRPVRAWIRGARGPEETRAAWEAAIALPGLPLRAPLRPLLVAILPLTIAGAVVLDLEVPGAVALFAGVFVTVGYGMALDYFSLEGVMRPVVADIASHLPREEGPATRTASLRVKLLGALPLVNIITGVVVAGITSPGKDIRALGVGVLMATAVAYTISLILTLRVSATVLRPVRDLRRAAELVEGGNLDVAVPVTSGDEIGRLVQAFNRMVTGLAERERIREAFGTYVDHGVAEHILTGDGTSLDGEEVEVTVLFLDVRGFTAFAHDAPAPEVVATLNRLFGVVVPIVHEHGGHVDKFIGDGVLAVFGAPERREDHAQRALQAALEIAASVGGEFGDQLEIGIGLNSGTVVAGSIGGAGRLNFSVIGDAVNVAARVEAATRQTGDRMLITQSTRDLLGDVACELEDRPGIELRGVRGAVTLYSPAGVG